MKSRFLDQRIRIHGRPIVFTKGIKPWRRAGVLFFSDIYLYMYILSSRKEPTPESYLFKWLFFPRGDSKRAPAPVFPFQSLFPPLSTVCASLHYTSYDEFHYPYTFTHTHIHRKDDCWKVRKYTAISYACLLF